MTQQYGDDLQQVSPQGGHIRTHSAPTNADALRMMSNGCVRPGECVVDLATNDEFVLVTQGVYDNINGVVTTQPVFVGPRTELKATDLASKPMAPASSDITLYYNAAGGDDDFGDGTVATPFASPQGAVDALAKRCLLECEKLDGVVTIEALDVTPTTYTPPCMIDLPVGDDGAILQFVASRQVISGSSTAATLTPVTGFNSVYSIPSTPITISDTVAAGSDHWYEDTGLSGFFAVPQVYGGVAKTGGGVAATHLMTPIFGPFVFGTVNFYPRLTQWETNGQNNTDVRYASYGTGQLNLDVRFVGIDIVPDTANTTGQTSFYNVSQFGSRITGASFTSSNNAIQQQHAADWVGLSVFETNSADRSTVVQTHTGSVFRNSMLATNGVVALQGSLGDAFSAPTGFRAEDYATLRFVNFGSDLLYSITGSAGAGNFGSLEAFKYSKIEFLSAIPIQISGTLNNLIAVSRNSYVEFANNTTFDATGATVAGHAISLTDRSHAIGAQAQSTGLAGVGTSGDVKLGGNGTTSTIAALPASDFALPTSEGGFAS